MWRMIWKIQEVIQEVNEHSQWPEGEMMMAHAGIMVNKVGQMPDMCVRKISKLDYRLDMVGTTDLGGVRWKFLKTRRSFDWI